MAILNYTTTISADKTIGEIQKLISGKGATAIMIDYEAGQPIALSFKIIHGEQPISFRLPANWQGVLKALDKAKGVAPKYKTNEQAQRVCWRIIKDWVEAQMAIIEAQQASLATVFLPYAVTQDGETVSDKMLSEKGRQLLLT